MGVGVGMGVGMGGVDVTSPPPPPLLQAARAMERPAAARPLKNWGSGVCSNPACWGRLRCPVSEVAIAGKGSWGLVIGPRVKRSGGEDVS